MTSKPTPDGQIRELNPLDALVRAEAEWELPDGEATLARLHASLSGGAAAPLAFDLAQTPAQFMGVGSKLALGATWAWALAGVLVTLGIALAIVQPWKDAPADPKAAVSASSIAAVASTPVAPPAPGDEAPPVSTPEPMPQPESKPKPKPKPEPEPNQRPFVAPLPQPSHMPEPKPKPAPPEATRPAATAAHPNAPSELELLRQAQRALDRGQHKQLLVLTRQLSDLYPKGMFVEEREAMRAMARCATGSAKSGESFVARYPDSVSTERVQAYCKSKP